MHSGTLSTDSPAAFGAIAKILSPHEVTVIESTYRQSFNDGFCNEWFVRDREVSSNPRTARILQLAIESNLTTLDRLQSVLKFGQSVEAIDSTTGDDVTINQPEIMAPYCLDWLRHYHLIKKLPSQHDGKKTINDIHALVMSLTTQIIPANSLPELIKKKLSVSYNRCQPNQ